MKNEVPYELALAAQDFDGVEDENSIVFPTFEKLVNFLADRGIPIGSPTNQPAPYLKRKSVLRIANDGRPIVEVVRVKDESVAPLWLEKNGSWVKRLFQGSLVEMAEEESTVDYIREVHGANVKPDWYILKDNGWNLEERYNCYLLLISDGYKHNEAVNLLGNCVGKPWKQVSIPFANEYPTDGKREWNIRAVQLRYEPVEGDHPTWDEIYAHLGAGLTPAIQNDILNPWARQLGIKNGPQYLLYWVANVIQNPEKRLPYLFGYGPENSGKSMFHEGFSELVTNDGCKDVFKAFVSRNEFNAELWGTVLGYVDEKSIVAEDQSVFARLRQMVTGLTLSIRKMRTDTFTVTNYCHFYHCANSRHFLPIWAGDTRITVFPVSDLLPEQEIPKEELLDRLRAEAPAFTYTLLNTPLPEVTGRFRLPVVITDTKRDLQEQGVPQVSRDVLEWAHSWPNDTESVTITGVELWKLIPSLDKDGRVRGRQLDSAEAWLKQNGFAMRITKTRKDGLSVTFSRT